MKFYTAKVICYELKICRESLEKYIRKGTLPKYERSPHRSNGVGYFESTFETIKSLTFPDKGRPKKLVT